MDDKSLKIVSLTSWEKRLVNLPTVLDSILKQTVKPDKIVLNLSEEEFPEKEKEIPENVLTFLKTNNVEIYWVPGKNTKQWKKFIPTLLRYPNDWVICIDDDAKYERGFIESLWNTHLKYPDNPITMNKGYKVKGYLQHCGCGTLECAKFYNSFKGIDIDEIIKRTESSDTVYNYLANRCGYPFISAEKSCRWTFFNQVGALSKTSNSLSPAKHNEIWDWLCTKYGKIETKKAPVKKNEEEKEPNKTLSDGVVKSVYENSALSRVIDRTKTRKTQGISGVATKKIIKKTKIFLGGGTNW